MKALIWMILAGTVLAGGVSSCVSSDEAETSGVASTEGASAKSVTGSQQARTPQSEPKPEKKVASSKTVKLTSVKQYCIHFDHFGMMSGKSIKCSDDYGTRTYEIKNLKVGVGQFSQSQNQHVITEGNKIIQWNTDNLQGTEITNHMTAKMLSSSGESAEDFGLRIMKAMGFNPDGTVDTIANRQCKNYSNPNIGKTCITDEGLTLKSDTMGTGFVATKVEDTAGDPENYRVAANVTIRQMGNIGNLMKKGRGG